MHRGVYFDGWFPRQHCYHPSLPPRRLRMVDDLRDYRATTLVWAALGGGSLSLPYLEQEAFGAIEPRSRFYGFVNDSEFIEECHKHGIKVFGIVFEAQGWEFPAELNDAEDTVLAMNELRGAGHEAWLGLREFSADTYPALWPPFASYFPEGLTNSDDEPVTDLIEECVARDIHQQPCHAHWVECPDRRHQCFYMDRNNPVWREYLKAIIRIQIDAGVDGIQLDEAELPMGAFQYGACFCKDCMKGFRAHLQGLPRREAPVELADVDLGTFHYGDWLLRQGYDFRSRRAETPLYDEYYRFQCSAIKHYFGELASFAREYARSRSREVLVSGNFFNLEPQYLALVDDVDVVITEMRNTGYRQPEWYRYVAGFVGEKAVIVVENPYGGVVPELVQLLKAGRGHDLFRLSLFEAAAFGANMAVPYGAWMGSSIQDAFYAPHEVAAQVQTFLADHEDLYSGDTCHEVAVVFSVASTREAISRADASDNVRNARDPSVRVPYRDITATLAGASQPFDVVIFPDGDTAPDRITASDLSRYPTVILPDCAWLTPCQASSVLDYLHGGGAVVVVGRLAENLPVRVRSDILTHPGTTRHQATGETTGLLPRGAQVTVDADVGVNITKLAGGAVAVHLVNYAYDDASDEITPVTGLEVAVRLPSTLKHAVYVPSNAGPVPLEVRTVGGRTVVRIDRLGVYGVVVLSADVAQAESLMTS